MKQALLMLSVLLLDGLILYSFRRALLALRFGGCGKYVRKKKRTERLRELSLWDRLTLASVAAECRKPETAQRIRRLYLGYAVVALLSDAFLLFAAASERLPLLWIWVAVCGSKWIVLAVLRILLFRNGLNCNPTVYRMEQFYDRSQYSGVRRRADRVSADASAVLCCIRRALS